MFGVSSCRRLAARREVVRTLGYKLSRLRTARPRPVMGILNEKIRSVQSVFRIRSKL